MFPGHHVLVLMAQVSDTHLLSDPSVSVWGQNPAENLASVMNRLPPVDAIVATGDIADDATIEAYRLADALIQGGARAGTSSPATMTTRWPWAACSVRSRIGGSSSSPSTGRWGCSNTQWIGHEAGWVTDRTLARLRSGLDGVETHVVLCLHHPPLSPCPQPSCGLIGGDRLLRVLRGGPVRVVLSGHVHQQFEAVDEGIKLLGAPSTFSQLRHGGDPHYTDTGEPPGAQLLELHDDGDTDHRTVVAGV